MQVVGLIDLIVGETVRSSFGETSLKQQAHMQYFVLNVLLNVCMECVSQ